MGISTGGPGPKQLAAAASPSLGGAAQDVSPAGADTGSGGEAVACIPHMHRALAAAGDAPDAVRLGVARQQVEPPAGNESTIVRKTDLPTGQAERRADRQKSTSPTAGPQQFADIDPLRSINASLTGLNLP